MIKFKIDVLELLKKKGYTMTRIRNEKLLSQSTLTDMRKGKVPAAKLDTLCKLTGKQPGQLIEYVKD